MGKWSRVRCNCHNRIPRSNNTWRDRPDYGKNTRKLSLKKQREIEVWKNNIQNMYECGHRDGMLIQLCPSNIIELGLVIKQVFADDRLFEIYPRISDWRNYYSPGFDEELHISPAEAELWLIEAIELERAFLQQGILYNQVRQIINILHYRAVESDLAFEQRILAAKIVPFINNLKHYELPRSHDSIIKQQFEAISSTKKLCQAAIDSGNPIEMLW